MIFYILKRIFSLLQKKLLGVNKTYIDISNGQKFELLVSQIYNLQENMN